MTCGVYKIVNTLSGKAYIGQSVDIESRWASHRSNSRDGNQPIYRAMRKYGLDKFEFSIIEVLDVGQLTEAEDRAIAIHKAGAGVYNIAPAAGSTIGFRHSEETKAKLSAARMGIRPSQEVRETLSRAQKASHATVAHCRAMASAKVGVPHSDVHKARIGAKSLGRPLSTESRAKISIARSGVPLSDEHRAKISLSLMGNTRTTGAKLSDDHKAKVSASLIGNSRRAGVKHTPESRLAMSEGQKRRWAERKASIRPGDGVGT